MTTTTHHLTRLLQQVPGSRLQRGTYNAGPGARCRSILLLAPAGHVWEYNSSNVRALIWPPGLTESAENERRRQLKHAEKLVAEGVRLMDAYEKELFGQDSPNY